MPNPTPKIISLGARMMQEPFWLGLIAVFVVLGVIGLIWCAKRHFPEKIEKLLAEEADRCARRKFGVDTASVLGGQIFRSKIAANTLNKTSVWTFPQHTFSQLITDFLTQTLNAFWRRNNFGISP